MRSSQERLHETRREDAEAIVAQRVRELFEHLPLLSGFWLGADLDVAELTAFPCGYTPAELDAEVLQWLADLAEEHPEAVRLMGGRAFARAVH